MWSIIGSLPFDHYLCEIDLIFYQLKYKYLFCIDTHVNIVFKNFRNLMHIQGILMPHFFTNWYSKFVTGFPMGPI